MTRIEQLEATVAALCERVSALEQAARQDTRPLGPAALARKLGVARATIYRMQEDGRLPMGRISAREARKFLCYETL